MRAYQAYVEKYGLGKSAPEQYIIYLSTWLTVISATRSRRSGPWSAISRSSFLRLSS